MPKRSRKREDISETAARIIHAATHDEEDARGAVAELSVSSEERSRIAAMLGRAGGLKGGVARAAKMTPDERAESARKAARARWHR